MPWSASESRRLAGNPVTKRSAEREEKPPEPGVWLEGRRDRRRLKPARGTPQGLPQGLRRQLRQLRQEEDRQEHNEAMSGAESPNRADKRSRQ